MMLMLTVTSTGLLLNRGLGSGMGLVGGWGLIWDENKTFWNYYDSHDEKMVNIRSITKQVQSSLTSSPGRAGTPTPWWDLMIASWAAITCGWWS